MKSLWLFLIVSFGFALAGCGSSTPTPVAVLPLTTPTFPSIPRRAATNTPPPATRPTQTAMATIAIVTPARPPAITATNPPPLPVVDQLLARCPTAQEVAAINSELKLSFEVDPTAGKLVCTASAGSADLTLLKRRVYQILNAIKRLQFSKPLPWTDKPLAVWLTGAIKGIRFRSDVALSSCCDPKDTINIQVASNSYLALTDRWVDPSIGGGLMDTAILFIHEARHNEGKLHTCGSDDKTIAELGAWGVQYYMELWLSDYAAPNFITDPVYRQIAKSQAEAIRKTRFCDEPK